MKSKLLALSLVLVSSFATTALAQEAVINDTGSNFVDELNPFDPNIDQTLNEMDQDYESQTGQSPFINDDMMTFGTSSCSREQCAVFALVDKSQQRMYLYVNGVQQGVYATSTGISGHGTPDFDTHPNGRVYDRYTSTKYPGGDYNGLGNMPYAVFISGGFAIHGTAQSNWSRLGRPASHGCIRIHPENARYFNRLVRQYGVRNVWITVQ